MPPHDETPAWPSDDQDPDEKATAKGGAEEVDKGSRPSSSEKPAQTPEETKATPEKSDKSKDSVTAKESGASADSADSDGGATTQLPASSNEASAKDAQSKAAESVQSPMPPVSSESKGGEEKPKVSLPESPTLWVQHAVVPEKPEPADKSAEKQAKPADAESVKPTEKAAGQQAEQPAEKPTEKQTGPDAAATVEQPARKEDAGVTQEVRLPEPEEPKTGGAGTSEPAKPDEGKAKKDESKDKSSGETQETATPSGGADSGGADGGGADGGAESTALMRPISLFEPDPRQRRTQSSSGKDAQQPQPTRPGEAKDSASETTQYFGVPTVGKQVPGQQGPPPQAPGGQGADRPGPGQQEQGNRAQTPPRGSAWPPPPAGSTHAQPMRIEPSGDVHPAGTRPPTGYGDQTGRGGQYGQGQRLGQPGQPGQQPGPSGYGGGQPGQAPAQQGRPGQSGQPAQWQGPSALFLPNQPGHQNPPNQYGQPVYPNQAGATTAGPTYGDDTDREAPGHTGTADKPRRKKRALVLSGSALVIVVLVGVALAIPYVSNHLGLPWAPNFPKADEPAPAAVALDLKAPNGSAPTPAQSGVQAKLSGPASSPALGTLAGIVIDPATGGTLWDQGSTQLLTPASATKLLTTSAALLELDHGLQLTTKVVQGSSPDTAVIVGGGDPTLSSLPVGSDSVYPGAAHLDELVAQVKQASGGAIKKVQLDSSLYSGQPTAPGWAPEDTPSTYAVRVVPGMLDGGRSNPTVNDVARTGDPGGALVQTFAQRLGATAGGSANASQDAKVLGEVKSAPITELVDNALEISDNNLAEAIGRQTAIASGAPATFAGVAQTTLNVLAQNGFDINGVVLSDGSGLSTMNKVSPKLLAQLLTVAAAPNDSDPRTAKLRPLLEGLPVAGGSGTLAGRYNTPTSSDGKGWVRAKTGTLSGVNTLAGLVLDADGRVLVFAMMSNGSDINAARPALDDVAAALRGCGCR